MRSKFARFLDTFVSKILLTYFCQYHWGKKKVVSKISLIHLGQEIRCATRFCANAPVHRYHRFGKETSTHRTKGSNCLPFEVSNWNIFILTKKYLALHRNDSTVSINEKDDLQKHRYLVKTSRHVLCYCIK